MVMMDKGMLVPATEKKVKGAYMRHWDIDWHSEVRSGQNRGSRVTVNWEGVVDAWR